MVCRVVNPNTVAVSCAISPDAVCGLPDDVAALSGSGHDRTYNNGISGAAGYLNTRLPFYVRTAESGGVTVCCLIARPCLGRNAFEAASSPHFVSCEAFPVRFCVPAASFLRLVFPKPAASIPQAPTHNALLCAQPYCRRP